MVSVGPRCRSGGLAPGGVFPILLGGDHSLAIGSIAGIAAYCAEREVPLSVLWLDAHADFNTPATTLSGNLHGMPVAVLTGAGPAQPIIEAARIIQLGVRSVDHAEKALVIESGLEVNDMRLIDERGMRKIMDGVLGRLAGMGGHVHVSFDVDFLDPSIAPGVATTVAGGPTLPRGPTLHGDDLRFPASWDRSISWSSTPPTTTTTGPRVSWSSSSRACSANRS